MAQKDYLRIGKISSFDFEKGTARITYEDKDDSTTAMFSLLAWEYWLPKKGDQVLVAHLSNGTCSAVILGPVWHNGLRPPEGFEGLYRKDFNNEFWKAYERYDANEEKYNEFVTGRMETEPTEKWTLTVGSCVIEVDKSGSINITAPAGIGINTPVINVTSDVIAGGISLQKHIHGGDSGGSTTKPK